MKTRPALLTNTLLFLLSPKFLIKSVLFSLVYLVLSWSIYNFSVITNILSLPYSASTKLTVLLYTFVGFFKSSSYLASSTVLLIAILFGINTAFLIMQGSTLFKDRKRSRLAFSAGFISIATTGCAACGFSLISLFGVSGTLALLPFHGFELNVIAIFILGVATYLNFRSFTASCKLPAK